ncbi:YecH family metal-binding protein [Enterovibrio norvegicus]|uniref:YecH family metal-binding protein n=1 Tax=Enterovibrio norvegicus TaxID=188144 RepID=UPI00352D96C5
MSSSVHVHQILNHLSTAPMSELDLTQWVTEQWGATARFHTCSQQDLLFSEVLVFLRRRKKIIEQSGTLLVNAARVCQY